MNDLFSSMTPHREHIHLGTVILYNAVRVGCVSVAFTVVRIHIKIVLSVNERPLLINAQ